MPVRYTPPRPDDLLPVKGVSLGTAPAKIKNWQRDDLLLAAFDAGTVAAGVFTQNRFAAAPVAVCRRHLAGAGEVRALVVNAGNANAGTGAAGIAAAEQTCAAVAAILDCAPGQVLPFSTGVIMEPLPVGKIVDALPAAQRALASDGWFAAASAIMTTDTVPKGASRRIDLDGAPVTVTGIAKGAGMIHPDMATMLSFIATDAPVSAPLLRDARSRDRRRLVQLRDHRRRHVDQRQLRDRRDRQGRDRAHHARRRRAAPAGPRRARRGRCRSSLRRSFATARARPSS